MVSLSLIQKIGFQFKPKSILRLLALIVIFFFSNSFGYKAIFQETEEYRIKVALMVNFTKFTEWPNLPPDEFIIGVWKDSPIVPLLQKTAAGIKIKNRNLIVEKVDSFAEAAKCNILFVPENTADGTTTEILNNLSGKNILVVGEKRGLAMMGASINFIEVGDKIKFEVNRNAVGNAGLNISSDLLKHAIVVR